MYIFEKFTLCFHLPSFSITHETFSGMHFIVWEGTLFQYEYIVLVNNQSIIAWYSARFEVIYDVFWRMFLCFDVFIITNKNSKFLLKLEPSRFFSPHWEKQIVTKKSGDLNVVKLHWHPSSFSSKLLPTWKI